MINGRSAPRSCIWILAVCFLAINVPIETWYSWRFGLGNAYYLIKVAGWALVGWGALLLPRRHGLGLAVTASGWGWLTASFGRALADRFARVALGQALRLGPVELLFNAACVAVPLVGLVWALLLTSRDR